ncbi:MAG: hypothetical protein NTZ16_00810 [Verrucomicrobia bacterium]|nr:hypothetical protein [Verrucomicrobiota bacterium]
MNQLKVGLLPLYVKFYDEVLPDLAAKVEPFVGRVQAALAGGGPDVLVAPVGSVRSDFAAAVKRFEAAGVDAIVTLHLAYSPSLESAEVLAHSKLPVVMLDTTPDRDFGRDVDPMLLLYNHGVHGLQDLASVLRRMGKPYRVVAGHLDDPGVVQRCVAAVQTAKADERAPFSTVTASAGGRVAASKAAAHAHRRGVEPLTATAVLEANGNSDTTHFYAPRTPAERAAQAFRTMRVLRIGGVFPGMGDFAVSDELLRETFGITVENIAPAALAAAVISINDKTVASEIAADHRRFHVECPEEVHARSVRVGLGLRDFLKRGEFGAFSLNFLAFDDATGPVNTVPFLECCQAMARGLGYAGEGDALTAALTGALLQGFGATTFTEIFCADWAGNSLFLSHMGEINCAETAAKPLLYEKEFPFTAALNPATLACAPKPGPGTYVNLSPGPNDTFRLITAPVEVLADGTHPGLKQWVRGWIRPQIPLPRFLEEFSHLGGTHHAALMFGDHTAALAEFAALLKIEHCHIA